MKLKAALKKFDFIKRLDIPESLYVKVVANLSLILKGSENKYLSPLGKTHDPLELLVAWDRVYSANKHRLNQPLLDIEDEQRRKFGPRSRAKPWFERKPSLTDSYHSQIENFTPPFFKMKDGKGDLSPISMGEAYFKVKRNTSSGLPKLTTKGQVIDNLMDNFDELYERKDPCMLYTRTAETMKTRNVWGYPFADIFYEMLFFVPFLEQMRSKFWQASIISPEEVDIRLTAMIKKAIQCDMILYSVDFIAYDASVSWQSIILAFDYVKSCFSPKFGKFIDMICQRFYTIPIVTPTGILRGKHGVPSGSCFTNLIDSIVQASVALSNDFIQECNMMINGDDGVYLMFSNQISQFEDTFKRARLKLGTDKSNIASNWCTYCQRFYHIDYIKDDHIGGIYPVYRALNRLIWLEAFTNLRKYGISSRDHFGIRTLTILEGCKYHPLFEELVRFILEREKYALNVSEPGLIAYAQGLAKGKFTIEDDELNTLGSATIGIKDFESYKLVNAIISAEGYFDIVDFSEEDSEELQEDSEYVE